ncbi:MAG: aromatic ring-hydroxylating dioxygenase subunit alpha [Halieaceae bacterium]|uniref:aromatic ring-hydroxylating oxygenase subunit alpha n=1 Tax=Haliea alexandrii TaxID=2448162 RepID=UPI000F0BAD0E|nr:aromatic ring-hydroxylating dioxygenase subunit alpha [Haliea alexandrii]MCR9184024.1 aromatic ring-hydroxylating dioxygenase subunit alpha [Halieaceae bacterium]
MSTGITTRAADSIGTAHEAATTGIDEINSDLMACAQLPLTRAKTLPQAAYTSEEYFQFERANTLATGWMCVAHVSQIKAPGSYVALDLLSEPLMVVRQSDMSIRVLSRICPHRAADIMHECFENPREGTTKRFSCPYHAWSFELDGKLRAAPEMQASDNFSISDWGLSPFRSEVWEGFVFVNLNGSAPALAEQYAELQEVIGPWNVAELEVAIKLDWECEFNWKVMIENWMESYHHMGAHHDTLQRTMPARTTWTEAEKPGFIHCHLPFNPKAVQEVQDELASGAEPRGFKLIPNLSVDQQLEWGLFLGFPCFLFLTMRDRVLWYRLFPISANRCRVETMTLITKENFAHDNIDELLSSETRMLSDFHSQDMQVNTAVQRGLASSKSVRGRLCVLEEPVWLIQRYLAARVQGVYPTRAALKGVERSQQESAQC